MVWLDAVGHVVMVMLINLAHSGECLSQELAVKVMVCRPQINDFCLGLLNPKGHFFITK